MTQYLVYQDNELVGQVDGSHSIHRGAVEVTGTWSGQPGLDADAMFREQTAPFTIGGAVKARKVWVRRWLDPDVVFAGIHSP